MIKKLCIFFILNISILFANENVVKTSELELFLFKVGFESLLKDVDMTKDKALINEDDIKELNSKIDLIMDEVYKNNRVLRSDTLNNPRIKDENLEEEILNLKSEISYLKKQMSQILKKENKIQINKEKALSAKVISKELNVREEASNSSKVLNTLERDTIISIQFCNDFGWCKLKSQEGFVARFLIDLNY